MEQLYTMIITQCDDSVGKYEHMTMSQVEAAERIIGDAVKQIIVRPE